MSVKIDFFFNSAKSLSELAEDVTGCLGCSLTALQDNPQVLFTRFLSMDFELSDADGYENDREVDFENFGYQLGIKTWYSNANVRPIQLPAIVMVIYTLYRQLGLTGILVFDMQTLLARYDGSEVKGHGQQLYDLVSDTPLVDFSAHLSVLTRRLPKRWQEFST